jgi:hypothetical protein
MTTVPHTTFKTRVRNDAIPGDNPFEWQDLTSDDVFKGKRVVLFALPGAFTPTCWRYAMVVADGEIEKMFIEPGQADNHPQDPFEVSDADTVLAYLQQAASGTALRASSIRFTVMATAAVRDFPLRRPWRKHHESSGQGQARARHLDGAGAKARGRS